MTASEKIDKQCAEALARLRHSINTRAGILAARVRREFEQARAALEKKQ